MGRGREEGERGREVKASEGIDEGTTDLGVWVIEGEIQKETIHVSRGWCAVAGNITYVRVWMLLPPCWRLRAVGTIAVIQIR